MPSVVDPHEEKRKEEIQDRLDQHNRQKVKIPQGKTQTTTQVFQETTKEETKAEEENKEKFSQLLERAGTVLFQAKTVFPFKLFPDFLTIDPVKLTLTHNTFFFSSYTESIPIANLTNVDVETSILFAALRVSFISYPTQEFVIKPLHRDDAKKARDIIAGLMVIVKEQIDIEKIPTPKVEHLIRIGETTAPSQ